MNKQHRIYEKVLDGDTLTDDEVRDGIAFHRNLCDDLHSLGPIFALAAKESRRVYAVLLSYEAARRQS